MNSAKTTTFKHILLATAGSFCLTGVIATIAHAADDEAILDEIVVVGSQIKGAQVTGLLPVTLLNESDMDAIAASSGAELYGSLPSNGVMNFNGIDTVGGPA